MPGQYLLLKTSLNNDHSRRLQQLLDKEQWTAEERLWLLQYLEEPGNTELKKLLLKKFDEDAYVSHHDENAGRLLSMIHKKLDAEKEIRKGVIFMNWKRFMIAGSILAVFAAGALSYQFHQPPAKKLRLLVKKPVKLNEIRPGSDNAILTLSDGSTILLDSTADGTLAQQGHTSVQKTNGRLAYSSSSVETTPLKPLYNSIRTARGNQYHVVLPDGTKVWLNAASYILFPTTFSERERSVEITGEAYFEVAPLVARGGGKIPFIVEVKTATGPGYNVQVTGTHFNINAYDDEPHLETTLLEGSVTIKKERLTQKLVPGQKATLNRLNDKISVESADSEEAIAWQLGLFEFRDANLHSIMRQVCRWYDVDVKISGSVSGKLYNGSIRRQASLSQVLQILKLSGVKYSLDKRTVIIEAN